MGIEDYIDTEVFYSPAYWIIVGMAIVGLTIGFGLSGTVSGATGSEFGISTPIKALILICIFPAAYLIIKVISR